MRRRVPILIAAAASLATSAAMGPLAHAAQRPAALGHGWYTVTNDNGDTFKRQFSFNAVTQPDATVVGNAELHNAAFDFTAHFDISCLTVQGNEAKIGGTVTKSNDPGLPPGTSAFFNVVDNGEPGSGTNPDTISAVFFDAGPDAGVGPDACPNNFDFDQNPIEGGNIQVQPTGA